MKRYRLVTAEQMRAADEAADRVGISSLMLMENAAEAVVNEIEKDLPLTLQVFCGKGQNGGDGFAVARILFEKGVDVTVVTVGSGYKGDALINYERLKGTRVKCVSLSEFNRDKCEYIIDALCGTGIRGDMYPEFMEAIDFINSSGSKVLSVDIPSGIDSDTGKIHGMCVRADKTVTFDSAKLGLYSPLSVDFVGQIIVKDIGIPEDVIERLNIKRRLISRELAISAFPKRSKATHKGDMGKAVIIGGSEGMAGAVAMSSMAAERAGAGLSTAVVPRAVRQEVGALIYGTMSACLEDGLEQWLTKDAMLFGNGMGKNAENYIQRILEEYRGTLIIDADGINALAKCKELLKITKAKVIITPHMGEMSRLTGQSINEITENRVVLAEEFANEYGITVVLKGYGSVVASPGQITYINSAGCPGMAKGGSGDVLAGIILGISAKGTEKHLSAAAGVYLHGKAGELAQLKRGEYAMTPVDMIEKTAEAISEIFSDVEYNAAPFRTQ